MRGIQCPLCRHVLSWFKPPEVFVVVNRNVILKEGTPVGAFVCSHCEYCAEA